MKAGRHRKLTDEQIERAKKLHAQSVPWRTVAVIMNISVSALRQAVAGRTH